MTPNWALKMAAVKKFGSQADPAMKCGLAESKVSRIVRGRIIARPEEREKISAALGVSEGDLWPDLAQ